MSRNRVAVLASMQDVTQAAYLAAMIKKNMSVDFVNDVRHADLVSVVYSPSIINSSKEAIEIREKIWAAIKADKNIVAVSKDPAADFRPFFEYIKVDPILYPTTIITIKGPMVGWEKRLLDILSQMDTD